MDRARALALRGEAHRLIFDQLGDGEAVMRLDQREVVEREPASPGPGSRPAGALEGDDVAPGHRQEIVDMLGGAERDAHCSAPARYRVGQHQRRGAVRHQRAVGALERPGDERVLSLTVLQNSKAEILAHLRQRVGDAVLWFFAAIRASASDWSP